MARSRWVAAGFQAPLAAGLWSLGWKVQPEETSDSVMASAPEQQGGESEGADEQADSREREEITPPASPPRTAGAGTPHSRG